VVTDRFQQFYEHWRDRSTATDFLSAFPYKLSLGVDSDGTSLLPFRPDGTSGGQILVTRSYDVMLRRLLRLRREDNGAAKGAVLTGQPGVGASLLPDPHTVQLTSASIQEKLPF